MRRRLPACIVFSWVLLIGCGAPFVSADAAEHNAAGADLLAEGRLDDAEARFRLALEFQPLSAEAHANLGLVAFAREDFHEAEQALRTAVELNEDFASAWANLGVVLERVGRRDEARDAYVRALSIQPALAEARRNLVALLLDAGDVAGARAHAMRLVQVEPERAFSHALLGYCELRNGRPNAAAERVARGRELAGDDPHLDVVDALILAARGQTQAAITKLEALAAVPDVEWDVRLRLAALYVSVGDRDGAATCLRWLAERDGEHPAVVLVRTAYGEAFGALQR